MSCWKTISSPFPIMVLKEPKFTFWTITAFFSTYSLITKFEAGKSEIIYPGDSKIVHLERDARKFEFKSSPTGWTFWDLILLPEKWEWRLLPKPLHHGGNVASRAKNRPCCLSPPSSHVHIGYRGSLPAPQDSNGTWKVLQNLSWFFSSRTSLSV